MVDISEYVIQVAPKSFCKVCGEYVHLLCHKDMPNGKPAFYICFNCETVGEVGVGPVTRQRTEE